MFESIEPYRIRALESRSASPGNPQAARGGVPDGQVNHCVPIPPGQAVTLLDVPGPGMVRSIWLTVLDRSPAALRSLVVRMYWDGCPHPSVEVPLGDFFGLAHGRAAHFYTPYLAVAEGKGFNCYFPMPFASRAVITITNDGPEAEKQLFYQVNLTLGDEITDDMARFHTHFRRETPPPRAPFVLLDTQGSPGVLTGMNVSALPTSAGTWREGDFRFYFDGEDRATIIGTGWSDWFASAWGLGVHQTLYAGSNYQVPHPDFGDKYFCSSYRLHVLDPVYFRSGLRIEHDQRGFAGFNQNRQDDWCATVWWYQQTTGCSPLPPLPDRQARVAGIELTNWEVPGGA